MTFTPNWVSPPGDTIAAIMRRRDISLPELAQRICLTVDETAALINGDRRIDRILAEELSRALGASTMFWIRREEQYRTKWGTVVDINS